MTKFVYIVGGDHSLERMFIQNGWSARTPGVNKDYVPDLICFTGGADVSPHMYGEENVSSHCDPIRDEFEKQVFEAYVGKVPMIGVCRGGQFLNVMNGGTMIQHIPGHSMGYRNISVLAGGSFNGVEAEFVIHEDHHQGIVPPGWLGIEKRWDISLDAYQSLMGWDNRDGNVEILWFKQTNCLCFQPHPEWGHKPTEELFFGLLNEYTMSLQWWDWNKMTLEALTGEMGIAR